jgi:hypothetical protein
MGFFDFLKKDKNETEALSLPIIHDVGFGRTVNVDQLAISMLDNKHRFTMPTPSLTITGQGIVQFEDGVWLHRFYTDDHILLQIMGGDGIEDKEVQQISIFSVYDSIEPANTLTLAKEVERLKSDTYVLDGESYQRVWFDGEGATDPVQFHEKVCLNETGSESYGIQQSCMLYTRDVNDTEENLLVTYEKTTQGDECVTQMVGITLSPNDLSL